MTDRNPEDYPKAYENSLDAQAIFRMIGRYKNSHLSGLALSQARDAFELIVGMLKRGEWLVERDALVAQMLLDTKPEKLDISPERAAKLVEDIFHTYPQLREMWELEA